MRWTGRARRACQRRRRPGDVPASAGPFRGVSRRDVPATAGRQSGAGRRPHRRRRTPTGERGSSRPLPSGPTTALAADLSAAAERALSRGGHAAAATAYERAAELTSAAEPRAGHLLAAARAAWQAGKTDRARGLLDQAGPLATAAVLRARIDALRGTIEFACGAPSPHTQACAAARTYSPNSIRRRPPTCWPRWG